MLTAKADEGSSELMDDLFSTDDQCNDVFLDLDSFWRVMGAPSEPSQGSMLENLPSSDVLQGCPNSKDVPSPRSELPGSGMLSPSHNSEASDCRTGCSDSFSESAGTSVGADVERLEPSSQLSFAEHSYSRSVTDCIPVQGNGLSYTLAVRGSEIPSFGCENDSSKVRYETPKHSDSMSSYSTDPIAHDGDSSDFCHLKYEDDLFGYSVGPPHSEDLYHKKSMKKTKFGTYVADMEDASAIDGDRTSLGTSYTETSSCEFNMADIPYLLSENGGLYLLNSDDLPYSPYGAGFESLAVDGRNVNNMDGTENKNEDFNSMMPYGDLIGDGFRNHLANCGTDSSVSLDGQVGVAKCSDIDAVGNVSKNLSNDSLYSVFIKTQDDIRFEKNIESITSNEIVKCSDVDAVGNASKNLSNDSLYSVFIKTQDDIRFEKNIESITSNEIVSRASEVIGDVISKKYYGGAGKLPATEGVKWSSANSLSSASSNNYNTRVKDEKEGLPFKFKRTVLSSGMVGETPIKVSPSGARDGRPVRPFSGRPGILPRSIKAEVNWPKMEKDVSNFKGYCNSNIPYPVGQNNTLELSDLDDESDVCILEDISTPARPNTAYNSKLAAASQYLASREPIVPMVMGHSKLKPNDERVIFRVAVQDLSQPKSEATPPDGLLAVPLLKHQRIALSWMVNKETRSACCSGGILADDQGLGKTVSTIALILKERSPSSKAPKTNEEEVGEMEMLNLDEDDAASLVYHMKETHEVNSGKTCSQSKARPAAGTLIVCPTSVLRQWSEELHNKVTSEANLSVLVYHGSNRTKDPLELAKYDVVITTYAIVSMEVPKQPVVDENDDRIGTPHKGFSSSKKRKLPGTTAGKNPCSSKNSKKGIDNELLETMSGPLAKVGWFRVVLDEAQSIKNHRTQVARACWGLRAKRRWCLSGTPIQNAIDDLYSYFRFLRHEPYAIFRTFCEQLKVPIHRNPKDGYKKLQAVLKTIMLRRTKGTFIDGEPIINLPPKTIELKKVDFSMEERDFYCRLEADSRAQFAEYAAAGTVKQNYVNILLMLLRLRQACDHPLLVRGFNSNSQMASSIEMAKKLPREKHIFLLSCLEASLAICGICSDPPEDAVVTVCGHVFCNQCICEQMIGDDTQCPTKNCKTHLTMSHVFSISTLRNVISDQQSVENNPICSGSENATVSESRSLNCPQGSSKIRAVLELLLSFSKPKDTALRTSSIESAEGCNSSIVLHGCDSRDQIVTSDVKRDSNRLIKIVGEKAIVFSQWTRMLDLLEACLKDSSIQYRRLDGTMSILARDRAVKDFNSLPQVSVMIMSLKAASLGLNMVAACHVILLDLWWNPTTEDQAIDRAHRIGQTRPVSVFRLTVKDTVEDRILALQQKKREMVASAFGEDGTGGRQTRLTVEDLKYLFRAD